MTRKRCWGAVGDIFFWLNTEDFMVLHPLSFASVESPDDKEVMPAWDAVAQTQRASATAWCLVTQPDHAALAGDLASAIRAPDFPPRDAEVIHAITLHDAGWAASDNVMTPRLNAGGRPLSFLEMGVPDFLLAWTISIERAEEVAPIGGFMVSEHFCRLGEMRLSMNLDGPVEREAIHQFLRAEGRRKERLAGRDRHSHAERAALVDALQFCDLLSLYLCCGAKHGVEFPQRFNQRRIRLWREGQEYRTQPALFGAGISLGVAARRYPASGEPAMTIPFLLA